MVLDVSEHLHRQAVGVLQAPVQLHGAVGHVKDHRQRAEEAEAVHPRSLEVLPGIEPGRLSAIHPQALLRHLIPVVLVKTPEKLIGAPDSQDADGTEDGQQRPTGQTGDPFAKQPVIDKVGDHQDRDLRQDAHGQHLLEPLPHPIFFAHVSVPPARLPRAASLRWPGPPGGAAGKPWTRPFHL
jgi:hypothetical protein